MSVPDNQNSLCKCLHVGTGLQISREVSECEWIIVEEMRLFQVWKLLKEFWQRSNADQFMFYKIPLACKWRIIGDGQEE